MIDHTLEMRTERLLMRMLRPEDQEEFIRVYSTSEEFYRPWFPTQTGNPVELFQRELERSETGRVADKHFHFIGVQRSGAIAGFFDLSEVVRGFFQNGYLRWRVAADVAGQGFATEGLNALLDFAFAPQGAGLHRVQANIVQSNDRSVKLAERVGLRREGVARKYLNIGGRWQDHYMYAKTSDEHSFRYLK